MCVCSCPLSRLSCILYCNSFLSLMREDWRDTNWTYVNLNSACLCSHTLWPISFSKNALVDLSAYIFWLVSQNVLQEGLSCCWSFFFLILGRKTEPAVHKHIHLSSWLDKELKRRMSEGETCSVKFILPSLEQHQIFSQLWFLLSYSLPGRMWSMKEDLSIFLAVNVRDWAKYLLEGRH